MADKASDKAQDRGGKLPLAKKNAWGYDTEQVDEFLSRAHQLYEAPQPQLKQEDIQNVLFTLVRGGYDIDAVDRALLRLEQAAVDKQTSYQIATQGRVAWPNPHAPRLGGRWGALRRRSGEGAFLRSQAGR